LFRTAGRVMRSCCKQVPCEYSPRAREHGCRRARRHSAWLHDVARPWRRSYTRSADAPSCSRNVRPAVLPPSGSGDTRETGDETRRVPSPPRKLSAPGPFQCARYTRGLTATSQLAAGPVVISSSRSASEASASGSSTGSCSSFCTVGGAGACLVFLVEGAISSPLSPSLPLERECVEQSDERTTKFSTTFFNATKWQLLHLSLIHTTGYTQDVIWKEPTKKTPTQPEIRDAVAREEHGGEENSRGVCSKQMNT
jgi:hypothetical protein